MSKTRIWKKAVIIYFNVTVLQETDADHKEIRIGNP